MVQPCLRGVAGCILLGAVLSSGCGGERSDSEPRSGMSASLGLGQAHRQMENLSVRAWLQTESGLLDIGPEAPAEPIIRYAESRRDGGRERLSLAAQDTLRPTDWPFYQELLLPTSADVEPTVQGFAGSWPGSSVIRRPTIRAVDGTASGDRADGVGERPGPAWLTGQRGSGPHLRADRPLALRAIPMIQAFRHEQIVNSL